MAPNGGGVALRYSADVADPLLTLGPSIAGFRPHGRRLPVGHGFATAGVLPGVGPVWLRVNEGWVGDGPGGPTRLHPSEVGAFMAECSRLSVAFNGHPTVLPLVRWGGTHPPSRPHVLYQAPPGRSLADVLSDGMRLQPAHAAGLAALVGQAWLDLRSRGVPAPTPVRSVWLATDSARIGLVDWLQPPDPPGTTVIRPAQALDVALQIRGELPGHEAFGWGVACLLWFCLGGSVPSLEEGVTAMLLGDWLDPSQLADDGAELAVVLQTAIGPEPPSPADLLTDLWAIAGRADPPRTWPTAVHSS